MASQIPFCGRTENDSGGTVMNMRKQLVTTVETILEQDERLVLLLGDIGVFGFRRAFQQFPDRVFNIGILEQSTISLAAGLAMDGFIPVVHTIAPFLVERSLEQLKDDFCYQSLGGNFISAGASYDYSALGCTHHCPGDVGILKNLPGMEIVVPGTAEEFDQLFCQTYANGRPTYYRLSERDNSTGYPVEFGKAVVVQTGGLATVVAVGPALKPALEACRDLDVTILYYTTVIPFDAEALKENCRSPKVMLCEPYYSGGLSSEILEALKPKPVALDCVGVPHQFLTNYGVAEEQDELLGLTATKIRSRMERLLHE
jgi:transketolase